jgi:hypothetical protein
VELGTLVTLSVVAPLVSEFERVMGVAYVPVMTEPVALSAAIVIV